jgi:hypothetical protein
MTPTPRSKRKLDSYESAYQLLRTQPLEPSDRLPSERGRFEELTLKELRQLTARSLPPPIRVIAFPLAPHPLRPHAVAEFAAELLLQKQGQRLTLAQPGRRTPFSERANLRWIVWGDLIASPGGHLALGPLSVGPYPGADTDLEPGTPPYRGVTSAVLRAIPVEHLISEVVSHLHTNERWHQHLADTHGWQPPHQQHLFRDEIKDTSSTQSNRATYPENHYRDVALAYLDLLAQGQARKIIVELAHKLGVSRNTARNWVYRARQLGYLAKGTQGRAGAAAGPRLHPTDDPRATQQR